MLLALFCCLIFIKWFHCDNLITGLFIICFITVFEYNHVIKTSQDCTKLNTATVKNCHVFVTGFVITCSVSQQTAETGEAWRGALIGKPCVQTTQSSAQEVQHGRFGICCFHDDLFNKQFLWLTKCFCFKPPLLECVFVPNFVFRCISLQKGPMEFSFLRICLACKETDLVRLICWSHLWKPDCCAGLVLKATWLRPQPSQSSWVWVSARNARVFLLPACVEQCPLRAPQFHHSVWAQSCNKTSHVFFTAF